METKYEIACRVTCNLFKNYNLTELFLLEDSGKVKRIPKNESVYYAVEEALKPYGISIYGYFKESDLKFRCITIDTDFPIDNEFLFKQIYGYNNFKAVIQISKNMDEECVYDFLYDVDSGECEFRRHYYGGITNSKKFDSFTIMMNKLREQGLRKTLGLRELISEN